MFLQRKRERERMTAKYCDLWGATLLNFISSAGAETVISNDIIKKVNSVMSNAIKSKKDIDFFHKKLMDTRNFALS